MKLKKVTALLLATSMVLSSVSVGTFADELVFEDEYSVTADANENVSFADEDVTVEQTATDDEALFDEVIDETAGGDEVVEDEIIDGGTADDAVDYAFDEPVVEEPIVDENEDLSAYINEVAGEAPSYVEESQVKVFNYIYDNTEKTAWKTDAYFGSDADGTLIFYQTAKTTADPGPTSETYDAYDTKTAPVFKAVNAPSTAVYWAARVSINSVTNEVEKFTAYPYRVVVNKSTLTATWKNATGDDGFYWRDTSSTGLGRSLARNASGAAALTLTRTSDNGDVTISNVSDMTAYISSSSTKWKDVPVTGGTLGTVNVGTYTVTSDTLKDIITVVDPTSYDLVLVGCDVEIKKVGLALTWDSTQTPVAYDGTEKTITAPDQADATKVTFTPVGTYKDDYTINYKGLKGTDEGSYTAAIDTIVAKAGTADDLKGNFEIKNDTFAWEIKKAAAQTIRVAVDAATAIGTTVIYYGQTVDSVLSQVAVDELDYYFLDKGTSKWTLATDGTTPTKAEILKTIKNKPAFTTSYKQYSPVLDVTTGNPADYYIYYTDGSLESSTYNLVAYPDALIAKTAKPFHITATPVVVTLTSVTVGQDEEPVDLSDKYTIADGKVAGKTITGGASALTRDIKDGKVIAELESPAQKLKTPEIQSYEVKATYTSKSTTENNVANYAWSYIDETGTPKTVTAATADTYRTFTVPGKYTVVRGKYDLKYEDAEYVYDGNAHTIKMTPETLPEGFTAWYSVDGTHYEKTAELEAFKKTASSKLPEFIEADDTVPTPYNVYIYVESGTDVKIWEKHSVTIKSVNKSKADEATKLIEEAVTPDASGNLDPDKIAAAREAYDALNDDQKALVGTPELRKLEDAEAAVKDQVDKKAAKAVEDEIDKLPAATEATAKDKEAADKAVEDYNKLTDDQKKLVPADKVKKMNDVKAAADAAGEEADKKAAKAVEDEIAALPAAADAKASDKAAADKAKADYDALTDAQKALVPAEAVDKMNAVKAAADEAAEKEKEAKEEVAALDEKVAAVKAAKNGADGKAAAEDAKDYYDKMSDEAKALMTDEEKAAYEASQEAYKMDKTFNSGEGVFRVLSNGEVTFLKPLHPENTWFVVPNQVKKNGFMYKVVKVSTKAFMGCEKATKIKIGKNVQSIGAYAFKNTPAMGKLIMLTSKLASGKVKDSFVSGGKDKGAKLTNEVPSGKSSAYESLFKGEGGMNAGAKFTEAD